MARLPIPGADEGNWGDILNEFLKENHRATGENKGSTEVFNVKDFGAKGDGIADDTIAIQSAIDAAQAKVKNPRVFFPNGTFLISSPLMIKNQNTIEISGQGQATEIKPTEKISAVFLFTKEPVLRFVFEGLTINGDNLADYGIISDSCSHTTIQRVRVLGALICGISLGYGWCNRILDCEVTYCKTGIKLHNEANNCIIMNTKVFLVSGIGGHFTVARNLLIVGSLFEECMKTAIYAQYACFGLGIIGCYFERNALSGLTFTQPSQTIRADIIINGSATENVFGYAYPCQGITVQNCHHSLVQAKSAYYLIGCGGTKIHSNYVSTYAGEEWKQFDLFLLRTYIAGPSTVLNLSVENNVVNHPFDGTKEHLFEIENINVNYKPFVLSTWEFRNNILWHHQAGRNLSEIDQTSYAEINPLNYITDDVDNYSLISGNGSLVKGTTKFNGHPTLQLTGNGFFGTSLNLEDYPELKGQYVWFGAWVRQKGGSTNTDFIIATSSGTILSTGAYTTLLEWRWAEAQALLPTTGTISFGFRMLTTDGESLIAKPTVARVGAHRSLFYSERRGDLKVGDGSWNGERLRLGKYYLWVDSSGKLKIKNGTPTSDTDGTTVGV